MFSLTAPTRISKVLLVFIVLNFFSPVFSFGQGNEFGSAVSLTSTTSCTIPGSGNPTYTMNSATASSGVPSGCVTGGDGNHYDVWFSFVAASASETVAIGNFGF